jgi:predicted ATPase/DNA-binding winged helix-turn-helix (wHTH) protein
MSPATDMPDAARAERDDAAGTLAFGPFRLDAVRRTLTEDGAPRQLGDRAMDILIALTESAGTTVTKPELMARAWPDTRVEEANLRVHMATIRKVLGDGRDGRRFIVNVVGQGYRFVSEVSRPRRQAATGPPQPHNLPAQLSPIVGREQELAIIMAALAEHRCVTIAGSGGMGKTTAAVAAAERLLARYPDGVWFIDLTKVADATGIPALVASVLGFSAPMADPVAGLIGFVQARRLLLLVDNCEHVIDSVAALVEQLLREAPGVGILATSREALGAVGEHVYRLPPLGLPDGAVTSAAQALASPAVQLLAERARANTYGFVLEDQDAKLAVDLCRSLDGLPLAIELAAARIGLFGLHGLAGLLEGPILLAPNGRRTGQQRHQTLMATLEWSYRLLSPPEQALLRRLSIFRGDFTIEGALAMGLPAGLSAEDVHSGIVTLSAKFLIAADVDGETVQYRLSHVTRSFARYLLQESGEGPALVRLHAAFFAQLLLRSVDDWERMGRAQWLATYRRSIDDVRAALDWAFSPGGDTSLGVLLTAAALPLGFQLALLDEFRTRAEHALMRAARADPPQLLAELRLNVALGTMSQNVATPVSGRTAGFHRAIDLAQQLDRPIYQAEPLVGMAAVQLGAGAYKLAGEMAAQASAIADESGDEAAIMTTNRITAQVAHFLGDHASAQRLALNVLDSPVRRAPLAYNMVPVDHQVSMRIILARVQWMQGSAEQAAETANAAIAYARADSPFALCQALTLAAVPIALWTGDDATAGRLVEMLEQEASRYTLVHWHSWARSFATLLRERDGEAAPPLGAVGALQLDSFATFQDLRLDLETQQRAHAGIAGWCAAEVIRVQGEILLRQGGADARAAAAALFEESRRIAAHQGALAWELRAAMSQLRVYRGSERQDDACAELAALLERFPEGAATADLRTAARLLTQCRTAQPEALPAPEPRPGLPAPGALIGRDADLAAIVALQEAHRLVTLTGPAGIGKTSLALAAAACIAKTFPGELCMADLAVLADPELVAPVITAALGLQRMTLPVSPARLAELVGRRRILLLIDNCEHMPEPVAALAEALLHGAPLVCMIATSQEPLRATGECVYRVAPLAVDSASATGGAVELFLQRLRLADAGLRETSELRTGAAEICRRLDGIPLAIELAAARAALIGVQGVAEGLKDRFALLTDGRRAALPRQRTMRAALDWSWELLSPAKRRTLALLSVFVGSFPMQAAEALSECDGTLAELPDCLAGLVARSLLNVEADGTETRYRMLETIRLYAQQHLPLPRLPSLRQAHLAYYAARLGEAGATWGHQALADWLAKYGRDLENVRAALHHGLGSSGDAAAERALGVRLAAGSMVLWLELSLHAEARQWAERALAPTDDPQVAPDPGYEMVLQVALGSTLLHTEAGGAHLEQALRRGLALAEARDDAEYTLRALYGLWVHLLHENEYAAAAALADRFRATAQRIGDPADMRVAERLVGTSEHYLGRQAAARVSLEAWRGSQLPDARHARESRFGLDQRVAGSTALARVMALQGEIAGATALAAAAVQAARELNRAASLCHALGEQCVLALWTAQDDVLAPAAAALAASATRHELLFWRPHVLVAQGTLALRPGGEGAQAALKAFSEAIDQVGAERFDIVYPSLSVALADGLAAAGQRTQAQAVVDQALRRDSAMQRWHAPEMLVLRGRLALANDEATAGLVAEADFRAALALAHEQSALLSELRAATALSQRAAVSESAEDGPARLRAVYRRFTEGFATPYLWLAEQVLTACLGAPPERVGVAAKPTRR